MNKERVRDIVLELFIAGMLTGCKGGITLPTKTPIMWGEEDQQLIEHEQRHVDQMNDLGDYVGGWVFWYYYLTDPEFRCWAESDANQKNTDHCYEGD